MTKPDFNSMPLKGLLEEYNKMSVTKRKAQFKSKEEGVARCEAEWKRFGEIPAPAPAPKPSLDALITSALAARHKYVEVIKVLACTNPRRMGTDAYDYFVAMQNNRLVEDYLRGFEDRKKARQWLWNTKRDGHIEVTREEKLNDE
jgi:hypothetical protein